MHVHALAWIVLAAIILTMIVVDIVGHVRTPHEPTLKEAAWWSLAYIAIALIFGGIVWALWGPEYGQEYLGGYITEKALSIDNLFVFVIILSSFRVPRKNQQEVLHRPRVAASFHPGGRRAHRKLLVGFLPFRRMAALDRDQPGP